ncbi:MAG TPA: hypothetical protein VNN75_03880, partial [Stellaceae bacterium]|nr:hypothetical protein [Stellaceae bacterium]
MTAASSGTPRARGAPVDGEALPARHGGVPQAERGRDRRHRKEHKNRLTPVLRNTVSAGADPLDRKL